MDIGLNIASVITGTTTATNVFKNIIAESTITPAIKLFLLIC